MNETVDQVISLTGALISFASMVALIVPSILSGYRRRPLRPKPALDPGPPLPEVGPAVWHSVRVVSLVFDGALRAHLQASMREASPRSVVSLLRGELGSVRLASVVGKSLAPRAAARSVATTVGELCERDAAAAVVPAPVMADAVFRASAGANNGCFVVTLISVAHEPLTAPPAAGDRASLALALDQLVPTPADELVLFEVVWSPSAEGSRFSSEALAAAWPELLVVTAGGRAQDG